MARAPSKDSEAISKVINEGAVIPPLKKEPFVSGFYYYPWYIK